MTFTLTATPDTVSIPPRVLLEAVESDSAKPIQSCQFYRDGVALRFAANIAGDTAVAYDYDAPFDVSLEYRADAVEADTLVLGYTEAWSNLSNWTSEYPGWSAGAGQVTTTTSGSRIKLNSAGPFARFSGPAPSFVAGAGTLVLSCSNGPSQVFAVTFDSAGEITLQTDASTPVSVTHSLTAWQVDIAPRSVTVSGTGWSITAPTSGASMPTFRFTAYPEVGTTVGLLDDVLFYTFSATTLDVTASDTTSLTGITAAWLTNAAQPELAIQVTPDGSSDDHICFSPETLRETTAVSSSVALDIEGSPDTLTVVTGPRRNKVGSAELICLDTTARRLLETLLANNATIGIRFPAVLDYMALDDGFYAVGDLTLNRVQNPWDTRDEVTMATLPLTPSRAPAFDVLWQWDYDAWSQTGLTNDQSAAAFPTYTDALIGPTT